MNAAFLMLTTALAAGADGAHAAPVAAPVMASSCTGYAGAPAGCGCGSSCDACCEKEGLLSKLRGKLGGLKARFSSGDSCDACDSCGGGSIGGKLRDKLSGLFRRGGDCCDTCAPASNSCGGGCASGGYSGTVIGAPGTAPAPLQGMPRPEQVAPPKESDPARKLPAGPKDGGKVHLLPQPVSAPVLEIAPTSGKSPF